MAKLDTDVLGDLRPNYLRRLADRLSTLEALLHAMQNDRPDAHTISTVHRTAHSMASSASIYGYSDLSAAARQAERSFEMSNVEVDACLRHLELLIEATRCVLIDNRSEH